MPDTNRARRSAALRSCTRMLSGSRPVTVAERLAALAGAAEPDEPCDIYGDGGPVGRLEERVASLLDTEAAVFFPTGTMAQQVALRYGAEGTGRSAVALHPLSHPEVHERHAYAALTGLRSVAPTTAARNATAAEIADLDEPVGTVVFELPLRDAGFVLPGFDDLSAAAVAARDTGARVHLDGARLWESTGHLGQSAAEVAALADSTYVSFYKSLGGISGAALAGDVDLAGYARAWRHRYGGNLFGQWPAALAGLSGLDQVLPRLGDYVAQARVVAGALAALPGARIYPDPPHTHQFRLWLPHRAAALNEAALRQAESDDAWFVGGWADTAIPGLSMAEVTVAEPACRLTAADVTELGQRFLALV